VKNIKLLSFLLLAMMVSNGFELRAVEEEEFRRVQVSPARDLGWGLAAGFVAGNATRALVWLALVATKSGDADKRLEWSLISAFCVATSACLLGAVTSKEQREEDWKNVKKYMHAQRLFNEVVSFDVLTQSPESLAPFVREQYGSVSPFSHALKDLQEGEAGIGLVISDLQELSKKVENSNCEQDEKIYVESKKLLKTTRDFQRKLVIFKEIILHEVSCEESKEAIVHEN